MAEYPVKLGSILFTLVEPHREHVVAYNRWYERDHFYAGCLVGPGILSGARWVATRDLKALRTPADSPIVPLQSVGSYLATYFISAEGSRAWGTWAAEEVHRLHDADRMFEQRDHVHTQMYVYRGGAFRDADGVPPELALDHRFAGLVVTFVEGEDRKALGARLADEVWPALQADSPVAMSLAFTPIPVPGEAPADVPQQQATASRMMHLHFLDESPATSWERFAKLGDAVAAAGGELVWCAPFIPTKPGTDTYTDQLW
jgi:hypothetical protein